MIEVYCKLIVSGRRTLEQVPEELKAAVAARLAELGWGNP